MTRDEARALIHPKLLDGLTVLGDGDKMDIYVTDEMVERMAPIIIPYLEEKEKRLKEKGA